MDKVFIVWRQWYDKYNVIAGGEVNFSKIEKIFRKEKGAKKYIVRKIKEEYLRSPVFTRRFMRKPESVSLDDLRDSVSIKLYENESKSAFIAYWYEVRNVE